MFLFAPGVLPSIRLAHTKYDFFPVRRLRVKTASEAFVASPLTMTTLMEKETLPVTRASDESVYVLLAALFDGRGTKPAAYTAGILFRSSSPWHEERLYVSEARVSDKTIDPVDTLVWAYAKNEELIKGRADIILTDLHKAIECARQSDSGIILGDCLAVAAPVTEKLNSGDVFFFGANGIGSLKVLWC